LTSQSPFPPPEQAVMLFDGDVMHARMRPRAHRFAYRVYTLLIDVTRLEKAHQASALFSVGRFNLLSFRATDHGDGSSTPLADQIKTALAEAGMTQPVGRILLSCYPRVLGFVFNPISVYFVYDLDDAPAAVVYEVRNTFGEMHTYVAPLAIGDVSPAGIRQERRKLFHVSPFMDMDMRYHFRLRPPGETLAIRILETSKDGPMLAATFHGQRKTLKASSIIAAFIRMPLMTVKVVAGIHFEALRLWLKGIRFYSAPPPPPARSVNDIFVGQGRSRP
jgi:uncharacterized protein